MAYKPPVYQAPDFNDTYPPEYCSQCGAYIHSQDKHTKWHEALARILLPHLED